MHLRPGSSLLLAKNDKNFNKNLRFNDPISAILGGWIQLGNTFLTYMLPWRLSRDSKRWSVVQRIFVSKAAMDIAS